MIDGVCEWCGEEGYVGQECPECTHTLGVAKDACTCRCCSRRCPECGGTGQRRGLFGSGYCVACNGSGRA